jgi:hypothetical protein
MAAARQGLAALHLREEEPFVDQLADHGQHLRQAADGLHLRIEVQQRMAPVRPTRYGPSVRRFHARIERVAKIIQPIGRDRSAEQGVSVSMELLAVNHGSLNSA